MAIAANDPTLYLHWGDLESQPVAERGLNNFKRFKRKQYQMHDYFVVHHGVALHLYLLGRSVDAANFSRRCKIDWYNAEVTIKQLCDGLSSFGSQEDGLLS